MNDRPTRNTITTHQKVNSARAEWVKAFAVAGLVAVGLLMLGRSPHAATGTLVPALYQTVFDANGNPISGAKICTYLAGTSTPVVTYTDVNLTVPATNPITADSAGRWAAFLTPGSAYKFVLQDATGTANVCNGAIVRTIDNVVGTPGGAAITGTWLPSVGGTATYASREGTYVRTGALVYARGSMSVTTLGTGSTGAIQGLPFPANGVTPATVGYFVGVATPVVWIGGYVPTDDTQLFLLGLSAAGVTGSFLSLIGDGTILAFSVVYQTAAP